MKAKIYLTLFVVLFISSNSKAQVYTHGDKDRIIKGELNEPDYAHLKQILLENTKTILQDTLIIKYDYNNETCWMFLDKKSDDDIASSISIRQDQVRNVSQNRKGVSIFKFKEKGSNLSKVVERDSSIFLDRKKQLFRLLFKKRSTCGNSIIILPGRKFILLRSDSHFEAMNYTRDQMIDILAKD